MARGHPDDPGMALSRIRVAFAATSVALLGAAVACGADHAIDKTFLGTWSCTSTVGGHNGESATVVVGDGTFQYTVGREGGSGTWKRSGDKVTITVDGGDRMAVFDVPAEAGKSMTFRLQIGDGEPRPSTATFDGTTLRFAVGRQQIHCVR